MAQPSAQAALRNQGSRSANPPSHGRPRSGMNCRDALGHRDVEQSVPVFAFGRHESPVETGAARTEGLLSRQAPPIRGESRRRAASRLSGGPDPVDSPRIRFVARFFQNRQCVDMPFDQSGKRQISCRPIGERREASRRACPSLASGACRRARPRSPSAPPTLSTRCLLNRLRESTGRRFHRTSTRAEPAQGLLPSQHCTFTSGSRSMAISTRSYP